MTAWTTDVAYSLVKQSHKGQVPTWCLLHLKCRNVILWKTLVPYIHVMPCHGMCRVEVLVLAAGLVFPNAVIDIEHFESVSSTHASATGFRQ